MNAITYVRKMETGRKGKHYVKRAKTQTFQNYLFKNFYLFSSQFFQFM